MFNFLLVRPTEIESATECVLFHDNVSRGHDIIQSTKAGKKLDVLKSPGQAKTGGFIRSDAGNRLAFIMYLTLLRLVETVNTVQQAGLTGAIRSDDSQNLIVSYLKIDIIEGFDTPESKGEVLYVYLNMIFALYLRGRVSSGKYNYLSSGSVCTPF